MLASLVAASAAFPSPQAPVGADVDPQARGGYGKQPDGYFQYVNVPAHKEYEFGWNRGNPHHYISRYEQSKDHRFRTRVRRIYSLMVLLSCSLTVPKCSPETVLKY